MLQARVEDDHVERDAFPDSRGVRVVAHVAALVFHVVRFILVAVLDGPRRDVDGDDLHLPFLRG